MANLHRSKHFSVSNKPKDEERTTVSSFGVKALKRLKEEGWFVIFASIIYPIPSPRKASLGEKGRRVYPIAMNKTLERLLEASRLASLQEDPRRKETFEHGQHPFATVLCCSDSRVIPERIFSCSIGDLFVIRTAGNALLESEKASMMYSYAHLGVRLFLVMGHRHCGAVSSTLKGESNAIFDLIKEHIGEERDSGKAEKAHALKTANEAKALLGEDACVEALYYDIETGEVSVIE